MFWLFSLFLSLSTQMRYINVAEYDVAVALQCKLSILSLLFPHKTTCEDFIVLILLLWFFFILSNMVLKMWLWYQIYLLYTFPSDFGHSVPNMYIPELMRWSAWLRLGLNLLVVSLFIHLVKVNFFVLVAKISSS